MTEHILNPTSVRFMYELATNKKQIGVPEVDMLRRMEAQGWIRTRGSKRPTLTPKGEIVLALLKHKAGVA